MRGAILFDNSALSRLVDESDTARGSILDALRRLGTPRITELNVLETVRTRDVALRRRKLEIYKEITGTVEPINEPETLLAKLARVHRHRTPRIRVGSQKAYHLLAHPSEATDDVMRAATDWARDQERRFRSRHEMIRGLFAGGVEGEAAEVLSNEQSFLNFAFETAHSTLAGMVTGFYRQATGADLAAADVRSFLDAVPAWKVFATAHLHSVWVRSIKTKGPEKRSAGFVDTVSAVYLNFCDRFLTNDKAQLQLLKVANLFNPRETIVERYSELRATLLQMDYPQATAGGSSRN